MPDNPDGAVLKASGVILPSGERRDLFVVDGQITYDAGSAAAANADSITDSLGDTWIVPGLVDAHCHIGLDEHGAVPDDVSEQQALRDRDAGTLLVRDAGFRRRHPMDRRPRRPAARDQGRTPPGSAQALHP